MAVAFVLAALADLSTMRLWHEANPVVLGLGPWAGVVKVGGVLLVLTMSSLIGRPGRWGANRPGLARLVLWFGAAFWSFGAITNLASESLT